MMAVIGTAKKPSGVRGPGQKAPASAYQAFLADRLGGQGSVMVANPGFSGQMPHGNAYPTGQMRPSPGFAGQIPHGNAYPTGGGGQMQPSPGFGGQMPHGNAYPTQGAGGPQLGVMPSHGGYQQMQPGTSSAFQGDQYYGPASGGNPGLRTPDPNYQGYGGMVPSRIAAMMGGNNGMMTTPSASMSDILRLIFGR